MYQRSLKRTLDRLNRLIPEQVSAEKDLAKSTTFRVGGPAAVFAVADTLHDLHVIVGTVTEYELPLLLLGRGSNLLISDSGFQGVVLRLGRDFQRISVMGNEIICGASVTLSNLIQTALKNSLKGLSFAIGIPGTVGAAVAINAGAYDFDMGSIVSQVTTYDHRCQLMSKSNDEIGFTYRGTALKKEIIILEARLRLTEGKQDQIKSEMEINFRKRKESQPLGQPSAGCIFKNPDGMAAGKLIDMAGCKGWKVGGAVVSEKHANYIVNNGNASAQDIYSLMQKIRSEVKSTSEVLLEPEINIIGDFEENI